MWRSSAVAIGVASVLLVLADAARSHAQVCLPPLYEDGSRLVTPVETRVLWLEPLLRQHEVCWRRPRSAGESRVFVIGSSGIFGYPFAARESAVAMVNRSLAQTGTPAHLFNLAMMWTYGAKDALILHEALRFGPDAIVYAVTLDDFYHRSPSGVPPVDALFLSNSRAADRAAAARLPGIGEPLERYRQYWSEEPAGASLWRSLREAGLLARIGARQAALQVNPSAAAAVPPELAPVAPAAQGYDCDYVKRRAEYWIDWQQWSLLPWLAEMKREHGTRVLVVNWPVARQQVGDCFNVRYVQADFDEYNAWLRAETAARGFDYLDLHDLLEPDGFLDSIHPNSDGQRAVAERLEPAVRDLLAASPTAAPGGTLATPPREP